MNAAQQEVDYFKKNPLPSIETIDKLLAEKSLKHFVRQAWHVVEPSTPFIDGWHIDVICEHLEAITRGEIKYLIINIPPRHMKSLLVSVFWPCWEWITKPSIRWLFSSYAETLSKRDSLKCRRIIQSSWYRSNWGDTVKITSDQNEKLRFENDASGYRVATSVGGVGTGEGGNRIVVDDPNNVKESESEVKRATINNWWDESMSTRLNNPKTDAKVIIQQRTHASDLTGHVLDKHQDSELVHLCLPARYEVDHPHKCDADIRTKDGDLLWLGRYGEKELSELEKDMGVYAVAGQLQQRPSPRGGGMFMIDRFKIINVVPGGIKKTVRYWDKAGTLDGGAYTAGVRMNKMADGTYLIDDVVRGQWSAAIREKRIRQTAELDGKGVIAWVEQEPGSGGKESAEATIKNLAGFIIKAERVTGAKEVRAEPYSIQVEAGNVSVLNKPWTKPFIDEHEDFPMGKFKDQVDSASGAFNKLAVTSRAGTW